MENSLVIFNNKDFMKADAITTSLMIAEAFGKEHKNVLKDIRNIISSLTDVERKNGLRFEPAKYKDAKGELRPMYNLNRDAFTLVVMGYTGKKAMQFKVDYINAFNYMLDTLQGIREARKEGIDTRNMLTQAIKDNYYKPTKGIYINYTNMAYLAAFGKRPEDIRAIFEVDNNYKLRDCLKKKHLDKIEQVEKEISILLGFGLKTEEITNMIKKKYPKYADRF